MGLHAQKNDRRHSLHEGIVIDHVFSAGPDVIDRTFESQANLVDASSSVFQLSEHPRFPASRGGTGTEQSAGHRRRSQYEPMVGAELQYVKNPSQHLS